MINKNKVDQIVISNTQAKKCQEWFLANLDDYVNPATKRYKLDKIKFPLREAVCVNTDTPNQIVYFKVTNDELNIKSIDNNKCMMDFSFNLATGTMSTTKNIVSFLKIGMDADYVHKQQKAGIGSVMALIQYIANYREVKERIDARTEKRINKISSNNKTKRQKKMIKVGIYYIKDYDAGRTITTPKQKHTESWGVRGHWRNYKTGKRAWVNPYIKGEGEKDTKGYRLG